MTAGKRSPPASAAPPDAMLALVEALRERLGPNSRVYYRHRPKNHHRKAGNIADFVMRWGGHYEHMVVLDADSLMTGEVIVRLVSAMENHPTVGLITNGAIVEREIPTRISNDGVFSLQLNAPDFTSASRMAKAI